MSRLGAEQLYFGRIEFRDVDRRSRARRCRLTAGRLWTEWTLHVLFVCTRRWGNSSLLVSVIQLERGLVTMSTAESHNRKPMNTILTLLHESLQAFSFVPPAAGLTLTDLHWRGLF